MKQVTFEYCLLDIPGAVLIQTPCNFFTQPAVQHHKRTHKSKNAEDEMWKMGNEQLNVLLQTRSSALVEDGHEKHKEGQTAAVLDFKMAISLDTNVYIGNLMSLASPTLSISRNLTFKDSPRNFQCAL